MKMFESFNFDIIIILILISSTVSGLYYNLYRQGRRTLVLIVPFIILFFTFNLIYDYLKTVAFINNGIMNIINLFKITYIESAFALIIYFASYIVLALLVRLIYSLFKVPVQNRVLNKASTSSRLLGSFLGLLSGYVIGMLFMFILNPFIGLNYEKQITKIYTTTSNDVLTFSSLNQLKNVNVKKYNEYEEILGELTGRNALNEYYEVVEIFTNFNSLKDEFATNIIPNLSATSSALVNSEDILNSFYLNVNVILENENENPNLNRLKEIRTYLSESKAYLSLYSNIENYEYQTISDYLINNYDTLISELTTDLSIDKLTKRVNIIKNYSDKRLEYLSLIDRQSVNMYEDVRYFEEILNKNTESVITNFNNLYLNKDTEFLINLNELFEKYNKNKEIIKSLDPKLSLSIKIITSDRYNYYYNVNSVLSHKLLKSYVVDTVTNKYSKGYEFYSEYVFYTKLAKSIDLEELSKDEFIMILNNLDLLVSEEVFSKDQAKVYFQNLFSIDNNEFFGLLNDELIEEIKTIENEYLNS